MVKQDPLQQATEHFKPATHHDIQKLKDPKYKSNEIPSELKISFDTTKESVNEAADIVQNVYGKENTADVEGIDYITAAGNTIQDAKDSIIENMTAAADATVDYLAEKKEQLIDAKDSVLQMMISEKNK